MSTPYSYPQPGDASAQVQPPPSYTLFDSVAVAIATLLGSPIAGTTLVAVNYSRLGSAGKGVAAIALGVIATVVAVFFGNKIPNYLSLTIAIGLLLLTKSLAQVLQGPAVSDHVNRGGKLGSRWVAAGIGVAGSIVIFSAAFIFILAQEHMKSGSKVTIGTKDTVYYSGSATQDEAQTLGAKLKDMGYFTDRGVTVYLDKSKNGSRVSFAVRDGAWDQPEMVIAFEQIGGQVARFLGEPEIAVNMVNTSDEVKREMTAGEVISGSKDAVFFTGSATPAEAKALGQALVTAGYLVDNGANVTLSKGTETVIILVVGDRAWDDPQTIIPYENTIRSVASSVGGLPIRLRLLNSSLVMKSEAVVQ